jgi:hypothetical protein
MSNTNFTLRYEDTYLEHPELLELLGKAIAGERIASSTVEEVFMVLPKKQVKYFAKLFKRVYGKGLRRRVERELAKEEAPVWEILPREETNSATA